MMKKNDPIIVVMSRNDIFPWQTALSFSATFLYEPMDSDSTYIVNVAEIGDVYINCASRDFVGLYPDKSRNGNDKN